MTYTRFPVFKKIPAGHLTVEIVFKRLKNISPHCFVLESAESEKKVSGRWTFLGFDPEKTEFSSMEDIRKTLAENRSPSSATLDADLPPFTGGLVGYFSFDFIRQIEPVLQSAATAYSGGDDFKDIDLMLFDKLVVFDNFKNEIIIIVSVKTKPLDIAAAEIAVTEFESHGGYEKKEAQKQIDSIIDIVRSGKTAEIEKLRITSDFTSIFNKAQYCAMVEKAKKYIFEGDIFQVVLSNSLFAHADGSLFETYKQLCDINPSPYMFYFSSDNVELAGASPETLVKLENGILHTFPLAGTRARGKTPAEDAALERELLCDEKEKAEHNMLVDLGRNDLGKICEFGSVNVDPYRYMQILRFSHVMHIGTTVSGKIRSDKTALDAIAAVLPAGTLSGAPKIRACQIIDELEELKNNPKNKRGVYGGAVGYIDFSGNMDTAISIRLAYKKNGTVYIRSGAGIVADSIPEREWEECNNKMAAVKKALGGQVKP
ncbi:MAG: anthranilate synthase component I [Treponemataceae bacterium]|nr:MAG: anthranilate synthase component I [Treponemataceae bacterium]